MEVTAETDQRLMKRQQKKRSLIQKEILDVSFCSLLETNMVDEECEFVQQNSDYVAKRRTYDSKLNSL